MSENYILWRWIRRFFFALIIALVLMWLEAQADGRPRYTLFDSRISFLFSNSDELPFTLIREMCWNDSVGFCDDGLRGAEEIYFLADWQTLSYGAIFQTDSGDCFWWMYRSEFGADGNPHIAEHHWVECPTISLN